jgi:hypothetical protein
MLLYVCALYVQHGPAFALHVGTHAKAAPSSSIRTYMSCKINAPWELLPNAGLLFVFALHPARSVALHNDRHAPSSTLLVPHTQRQRGDSKPNADADDADSESESEEKKTDGRFYNRGSATRKSFTAKLKSLVIEAYDRALTQQISNPAVYVAENFDVSVSSVCQWTKAEQRVRTRSASMSSLHHFRFLRFLILN